MICPHCHQKIKSGFAHCPHCGAQIPQQPINDEPRLGRGMKVFLTVGAVLLAVFGAFYYIGHHNDPEYTRTPGYLEPDSNLVEQLAEPVDTVSVDPVVADSIERLEKEEAEKVFNSIRNPSNSTQRTSVEDGEGEEEVMMSDLEEENTASSNANAPSGAPSSESKGVEGE